MPRGILDMDKIFRSLCSRLFLMALRSRKGVSVSRTVFLKGMPIIFVRNGGKIIVGEEVVLNSKNRKYHVNMHSPIKLVADGVDARIVIGKGSRIHGTCINAGGEIRIGENCLIAANCQIIDNSGHDVLMLNPAGRVHTRGDVKRITIENDVWIGMNCIVLPGSTIRRGSVISAGSIVRGDIPENSIFSSTKGIVLKTLPTKTGC
jgi:acetyltransferase-like isoleucine patch superfamily enzyme